MPGHDEPTGIAALENMFRNIQNIPPSVTAKALDAMAAVAAEKIRNRGNSMGVRDPESSVHILDTVAPMRENFDRVLWLDSDMCFDRHLFRRLSEHLDLGKEMITGIYTSRKPPIRPVIYKNVFFQPDETGTSGTPIAETWWDFPRDDLFEVAACGFGAVMMTTDVLKRVQDAYGLPFSPVMGFGEDLSFCLRVKELGIPMWCDSSIKVGHVGTYQYTTEDLSAEERTE